MGIAELFASTGFLFVYSGLLVVLTALAIVRNQISLEAEARASRDLIKVIEAAHARDAAGKVEQLLLLNQVTGARILTHEACRSHDLAEPTGWRAPEFATERAVAGYLTLMAAVPVERHSLEGLRPARTMIEDEYRRLHKGLVGFADFIIRVALLGTFMGLIAALTIASTNIGAAQGSEAAQSAHMRDFIQILLATAANKFWISAVGIACALVVQVYRATAEKAAHIARLGEAFDRALTDPGIAAAWRPSLSAEADLDPRLVREAIGERIAKLNLAPLEAAIAETAAVLAANAKHSVLSFGPALSPRSGE